MHYLLSFGTVGFLEEVASFRPQLASLLGIADERPDLVVRFGYGPNMPMSMRRPIADVMTAL